MNLRELHPRRFFLEAWRGLDAEAKAHNESREGYDWRPLVAFATGAVFLTLMEYFGMPTDFRHLVEWMGEGRDPEWLESLYMSPWWELMNHAWWAAWRVLGFFLLPVIVIWSTGGRVRDQNMERSGFREKLWIYVLSYLVVLGFVVGVSFTEGFQTYYPFYGQSSRSWLDFGLWEVLYLAQFFSLEFFFRGWWLRAGESMGSKAIFAMTVPYVMIHFGKEFPETLGAIFAGIFLGTLAMRTRSIWGGFLVHGLVAISMDVAAMLQTTGLPTRFWPEFMG